MIHPYSLACIILRFCSEMGHAPAQTNLAGYYLGNYGHEKNLSEAFKLYSEAALSGGPSDTGWPEAQYQLAKAYKKGMGTEINQDLSMYWLQQAALQGHSEAKKELQTATNTQQNP